MGTIHMRALVQANAIMIRALFLVLCLRYLRGEVMDQYRSRERMKRLKMEALEAV